MTSKIKIKKVKSWRNIPVGKNTSGTRAMSHKPTNTIYAIKGKTSKAEIYHEEYHLKKKHPDKPHDYHDFINQEISADLYAHKKTKTPRHVLMTLRGIVNETHDVYPKVKGRNILKAVKNEIKKPSIPSAWKKDLVKLNKEYNK